MNNFKERWDANVAHCKKLSASILPDEASEICTLNEAKTPFQNAMEYAASEGLYFGDPEKPKQTLAKTLADVIVKRHEFKNK